MNKLFLLLFSEILHTENLRLFNPGVKKYFRIALQKLKLNFSSTCGEFSEKTTEIQQNVWLFLVTFNNFAAHKISNQQIKNSTDLIGHHVPFMKPESALIKNCHTQHYRLSNEMLRKTQKLALNQKNDNIGGR